MSEAGNRKVRNEIGLMMLILLSTSCGIMVDTSVFRQTLMRASARLIVFFALASAVGLLSCTDSPPTAPRFTVVPVSVSAGAYYTCGVTPSGAAYCWRYNTEGELGNGTTTGSLTPVAVSGGLTF